MRHGRQLRAGDARAFANIRIFDRSPAGCEGPWLTYARMETLRSPKQLTGPAYGMASLTFRAWFVAQFGNDAWTNSTRYRGRCGWSTCVWYRKVLDLPVENGVEVKSIVPEGRTDAADAGRRARERSVLARKVVMATGRDGMGHPSIPGFVKNLPQADWAHSSDSIDFAALRGKRVVVVGVGASAVDNAAEALEAGAARSSPAHSPQGDAMHQQADGHRLVRLRRSLPANERRLALADHELFAAHPDPGSTRLDPARQPASERLFPFRRGSRRVRSSMATRSPSRRRPARPSGADFLILGTGFQRRPVGAQGVGRLCRQDPAVAGPLYAPG